MTLIITVKAKIPGRIEGNSGEKETNAHSLIHSLLVMTLFSRNSLKDVHNVPITQEETHMFCECSLPTQTNLSSLSLFMVWKRCKLLWLT